jgi:heterodisulfide reductase subunit D
MRIDTKIDEIGKAAALCLRCNVCTYGEWPENLSLCPMYSRDKIYTSSPGGLMYLVRALLENKIEYTPDLSRLAYGCINCRACDDICEIVPIPEPHVVPTEIVRLLRYELVKRDLISNRLIRKLFKEIKREGGVGKKKIEIKIPEGMKNKKSKNILFIEGSYPQGQKQIYRSALKVLQKIGLDIYVLRDEGSCGADLYDLGFIDELKGLLERKFELINLLADKNLIFIDPHTQEFVLRNWQQYVRTDKKLVGKHLSEVVLSVLKRSKIRIRNVGKIAVSYHDPCLLGRGLGIYEFPRKLITFFKGVTLLEMERNRKNSYCCGSGDGTRGKAFPKYSEWVARERFEEFKKTGADVLITSCPYCKDMFEKILESKEKAEVKDLIEFVNERIDFN